MKRIVSLLLVILLTFGAASAQTSSFSEDFMGASVRKPKMRVWWQSLNMSDEQMRADVQAIAGAGYGGIELNYGNMDDPQYAHCLEVYCQAAQELGLEIDKKYADGAPAYIPATGDAAYNYEITAKSLSYAVRQLSDADFEDGEFVGQIPHYGDAATLELYSKGYGSDNTVTADNVEEASSQSKSWNAEEQTGTVQQLAVIVAKLLPGATRTDIMKARTNPTQPEYELGTQLELEIPVQMLDQDGLMVLEEGETFQLPQGDSAEDYVIFTFFVVCEDSGESLYTDQYSEEGTLATLEHWKETNWTDATAAFFRQYGGDLFDDSNEDKTDLPWSLGLAEAFEERYGYGLTSYLPLLINRFVQPSTIFSMTEGLRYGFEDGSDGRVFIDYKNLLSDLYRENHVIVSTQWCEDLGFTFRVQAYQGTEGEDSYFDATSNSYDAGIMEGESLAFMEGRDGYNSWRYLTAGMHLADKQILSNELGAVFGIGITYSQTYVDLLALVNKNAIAGANEYIVHGYSAPDYDQADQSSWPGYHEFGIVFTEHWTTDQPAWVHMNQMTDYMARLQQITQAGTALMDVAFYRDVNNTKYDQIQDSLLTQYGYNYDFISPELLTKPEAQVQDGLLDASGSAYKALVLDRQQSLSLDTAQTLIDLAGAGLPIILVGDAPSKTKSYAGGDYAAQDKKLAVLMEQLLGMDNVYRVEAQRDIASKLLETGIRPYVDYVDSASESVMALTRVDQSTYDAPIAYNLFYNCAEADATIQVKLNGQGQAYLLGLFDGSVKAIEGAGDTLELCVQAGDMVAIAVSEMALSQDSVNLNRTLGDETDISRLDWQMTVDSYTSGSATDAYVTNITTLDTLVGPLTIWKDIEGLAAVSGNAVYTLDFDYTPQGDGALLTLDAASGTMLISQVVVNGQDMGRINQFTGQVEVGSALVQGQNTIEIRLSSTLQNAHNYNKSGDLVGAEYGLVRAALTSYTVQ